VDALNDPSPEHLAEPLALEQLTLGGINTNLRIVGITDGSAAGGPEPLPLPAGVIEVTPDQLIAQLRRRAADREAAFDRRLAQIERKMSDDLSDASRLRARVFASEGDESNMDRPELTEVGLQIPAGARGGAARQAQRNQPRVSSAAFDRLHSDASASDGADNSDPNHL
jgi:hypothetical protein